MNLWENKTLKGKNLLAATAPAMTFQICPPAPAHILATPEYAFAHKPLPVNGEQTADGFSSTGLSFGNYNRMHIQEKGQNAFINRNVPAWALNDSQTALVIVRYLERSSQCVFLPGKGSLQKRMHAAQGALEKRIPALTAVIDSLCGRYVQLKSNGGHKKELRMLEQEIESYDSRVRMIQDGPAYLAAVISYRYRVGMNSSEIAQALGYLKPPHIRHLLYRLNKIARDIESGEDIPRENPKKAMCIRLAKSGMGISEIAVKLAVPTVTVRYWLITAGVFTPRPYRRCVP